MYVFVRETEREINERDFFKSISRGFELIEREKIERKKVRVCVW